MSFAAPGSIIGGMDLTNRRNALIMFALGLVALVPLALVLDAADRSVQLAVAIAAIALVFASYVRLGVLGAQAAKAARASGEKTVSERTRRRLAWHMPVVIFAPLVVVAAHPWGEVSFAVAGALLIVPHMLYMHTLLVVGAVMKRRERKAPPADGGATPAA